jgi:hypothetical protein
VNSTGEMGKDLFSEEDVLFIGFPGASRTTLRNALLFAHALQAVTDIRKVCMKTSL